MVLLPMTQWHAKVFPYELLWNLIEYYNRNNFWGPLDAYTRFNMTVPCA